MLWDEVRVEAPEAEVALASPPSCHLPLGSRAGAEGGEAVWFTPCWRRRGRWDVPAAGQMVAPFPGDPETPRQQELVQREEVLFPGPQLVTGSPCPHLGRWEPELSHFLL